MYRRLLQNHILANLTFILVVCLGVIAYATLPRQQDPSVNFNWVEVHTRFAGASAVDVEERVTDVLEKGVQRIKDVRFSKSESRSGFSRIIVRFGSLGEDDFDDRVADLRREIQNRAAELPAGASTPELLQIDSDNQKPTALLLVVGQSYDALLRRQADRAADDIERFANVARVDRLGLREPELQVLFDAVQMQGLGVPLAALSETVRAYFRDSAAGSLKFGDQNWLVRLAGTRNDPAYLENLPLISTGGEVPLRSVAEVVRTLDEPTELVEYHGRPAVLLAIYKDADSNLLELVDRVDAYAAAHNGNAAASGISMVMLDDQTGVTRRALAVMESNALVGLALVLAVTWALLGWRIAIAASLGIPFALAGTLALAALLGETLNVVVLLGLVISLGMLVDDAVVVAEAIHLRLKRGMRALDASVAAIHEVGTPVVASVLTTIAAFLPLMLIPGVLGDYMYVAPLIVAVALLISLVEALWILPSHVIAGASVSRQAGNSRAERLRSTATRRLRNRYSRMVIWALRHPRAMIAALAILFGGVVGLVQSGLVRVDYFATDSARLFYVNVDMPPGTSLENTLAKTTAVEAAIRPLIAPQQMREIASYAGLQIAQSDTLMSDNVGQVAVSLHPPHEGDGTVAELIDSVRAAARSVPGPENIAFLEVRTGPPTESAVSVKLRGDDMARLAEGADALQGILASMGSVTNVRDDDVARRTELQLRLDPDALVRSRLDPATVTRAIQLLVDGEVVASMRDQGDTIDVRVQGRRSRTNPLNNLLDTAIDLPGGGTTSLRQLVDAQVEPSRGAIRHHNFRRAITVSADLDGTRSDTLSVNREIRERWGGELAARFPDIDLDFSGEMDDINESLQSIGLYFLLGLVLIYMILGTQFRSYFQPLIVLATVPAAFAGVVIGVAVSGHALSLYTLYGAVALAGIAVNSAIVFVSAANERVRAGMSVGHATVFAARRRFVPICITSLTTIAGLFSLAIGLAGHSNVWGPVASAVVFGLGVSTLLTLLVAPLVYARFPPHRSRKIDGVSMPVPLDRPRGLIGRCIALPSGEWSEQRRYREDRRAIAADPRLAAAYRKAREAMAGKDYLTALKLCQYVAEKLPDVALPNRAAAHACLAVLHEHGWDEGYEARARRFLRRALRRAPRAPDVLALKQVYVELHAAARTKTDSATTTASAMT